MPNPWKLRQEMCELGRRMYERGLVSAFEGNLSVRIAPDRLLTTPSLMCKGLLKPEDLCVVDLSGKQVSGEKKRSSEIYLHLAIYRERPEAESVVHTHAPHASAFAITHTTVPSCVTGEVEVFLGEVPLVPYALAGSEKMGEAVAQVLRESLPAGTARSARVENSSGGAPIGASKPAAPERAPARAGSTSASTGPRPPYALLLANHGVVSWGASLSEAMHRTEILEAYCRTLILARSLGPLQPLNDMNMRDLMALKQRLGLLDRRAGKETFDNCDLCANNMVGRGFCETEPGSPTVPQQAQPPVKPPASDDVEAIVREITERIWSEAEGLERRV